MASELTMELMTDIASAVRGVARDYLPTSAFSVYTVASPQPAVVLRIPGATNKPIESALHELAEALRDVIAKTIPSLPLRFMVIGGSEAAGIEITVQTGAEPVYGHIIKAKVDRLFASPDLKGKPQLVDEILKGGQA